MGNTDSTVHPTDGAEASTSEQISNGNTQQQHDAASQPQQSDVQPVWNSGPAATVSSYNNNSGAHSSPQVKRLRRPSLLNPTPIRRGFLDSPTQQQNNSSLLNGHGNSPSSRYSNSNSLSSRHSSQRLDTSFTRRNYNTGSLFSPKLMSPEHNIHIRPGATMKTGGMHSKMFKSRIGIIPSPKTVRRGPNTPGSVRIHKPDNLTPKIDLSIYSRDKDKSGRVPTTEEVLSDLRASQGEKRKRRDSNSSSDSTPVKGIQGDQPSYQQQQQYSSDATNKRRRPNESVEASSEFVDASSDFVRPASKAGTPVPAFSQSTNTPSIAMDTASEPASPTVTPSTPQRRDGHTRTALESSFSSSRRALHQRWREANGGEQQLPRSCPYGYTTNSRASSRLPTPVHLENGSETGSRISVTPLHSVKNSPRGSPVTITLAEEALRSGQLALKIVRPKKEPCEVPMPTQTPISNTPTITSATIPPPTIQPSTITPPTISPSPIIPPPTIAPPAVIPPAIQPQTISPPSITPSTISPPTISPPTIPPQLEERMEFTIDEPVIPQVVMPYAGWVATLEDREHDREMDRRRVEKMLRDIESSDEENEQEQPAPTTPQVVMPIVPPTITIPKANTLVAQKAASNAEVTGRHSTPASVAETKKAEVPAPKATSNPLVSAFPSAAPIKAAGTEAKQTKTVGNDISETPVVAAPSVTAAFPGFSFNSSSTAPPAASAPVSGFNFNSTPAAASVTSAPVSGFNFNSTPVSAVKSSSQTAMTSLVAPTTMTASAQQPLSTAMFSKISAQHTVNNPSTALFGNSGPTVTNPSATLFGFGAQQPAVTTSSTALFGFGNPSINTLSAPNAATDEPEVSVAMSITSNSAVSLCNSASMATIASNSNTSLTVTPSNSQTSMFGNTAAALQFPVTSAAMSTGINFMTGAPIKNSPSSTNQLPNQSSDMAAIFGGSNPSSSSASSVSVNSGPPAAASAGIFSGFGTNNVTSISPAITSIFGNTAPPPAHASAHASAPFGQKLGTTAAPAASSIFGGGATGAQPTPNPAAAFGGFSSGSNPSSVFGGASSTTPFGAPASTSAASSVFGGAAASAATSKPSIFSRLGTTPTAAPTGTKHAVPTEADFGPLKQAFGSGSGTAHDLSLNKPAFGSGSTPAFGSTSQATAASSVFGKAASSTGATSGIFGKSTTATDGQKPAFGFGTGFGQSASAPAFGTLVSSAPTPFGSGAPAFGSSNTNGSAPAFGSSTSTPAFGAASSGPTPAFGAASSGPTPAFGAAANSGAFGGSTQSSGFNFGTGQGSGAAPAFGSAAPTQSTATPFGAPANSAKPAGFNFGAAAAAPPAFGSGGLTQFSAGSAAPSAGGMFSMGTSKPVRSRRSRK